MGSFFSKPKDVEKDSKETTLPTAFKIKSNRELHPGKGDEEKPSPAPEKIFNDNRQTLFSSGGLQGLRQSFLKDPTEVESWPLDKIESYLKSSEIYPMKRRSQIEPTEVKSISDLKDKISNAIAKRTPVRVMGSGHSFQDAIFTESKQGVNLKLSGDAFNYVALESEGSDDQGDFAIFTVGAGCHLGLDPVDTDSTLKSSLCYQLTEKGYALPIVGGIIHQTVAGFMQTGSAGGSAFYGFTDCLESFCFMNGKGEIVVAKKGTDIFNAAGVSMGLMGVVIDVTLKVRKTYTVTATEEIVSEEKSWVGNKIQGEYPFQSAMKEYGYIHINWFPQPGVRRVLQWAGKQAKPFIEQVLPALHSYKNVLGKWWASGTASTIFKYVDRVRQQSVIDQGDLNLIAFLFKRFLPLTILTPTYRDLWYKILPTENDVPVDGLMATLFTEIWFPMEQTTSVIDKLKELYTDSKVALGNYALEMYCAHESPFWLSPAYGRNVVRIDPLWWAHNTSDPVPFFNNFFNALLSVPGARLHWGKYLPEAGQSYNGVKFDLDYLKTCYPKMEDWLKIREAMDPQGIFMTDYWRKFLVSSPAPQLVRTP